MPFILTLGPMATMGVSSIVMLAPIISQLAAGTVDFIMQNTRKIEEKNVI